MKKTIVVLFSFFLCTQIFAQERVSHTDVLLSKIDKQNALIERLDSIIEKLIASVENKNLLINKIDTTQTIGIDSPIIIEAPIEVASHDTTIENLNKIIKRQSPVIRSCNLTISRLNSIIRKQNLLLKDLPVQKQPEKTITPPDEAQAGDVKPPPKTAGKDTTDIPFEKPAETDSLNIAGEEKPQPAKSDTVKIAVEKTT